MRLVRSLMHPRKLHAGDTAMSGHVIPLRGFMISKYHFNNLNIQSRMMSNYLENCQYFNILHRQDQYSWCRQTGLHDAGGATQGPAQNTPLRKSAPYHVIVPHRGMMVYRHCVTNNNGRMERAYATGSRRMDLGLPHGRVSMAMERKVWRDHESDPQRKNLRQLDGCRAGWGLMPGWWVSFDQRRRLPASRQRTATAKTITPAGRQVTVMRAS